MTNIGITGSGTCLPDIFGIAIAVALLITLSALSTAYREAARIPLEEVGADIIVQKYGSVPKAVSGPILSCAAGIEKY